jgi:hypothetical protein
MTSQAPKTGFSIEVTYIDTERNARYTGLFLPTETDEIFNSFRPLESKRPRFLLDLWAPNGERIDTIGISKASFTRITGLKVESDDYYRKIDDKYWEEARRHYGIQKKEGMTL